MNSYNKSAYEYAALREHIHFINIGDHKKALNLAEKTLPQVPDHLNKDNWLP
ncbi:MAG: hypothetical protein WKF70_09505 [Chitinophagaceae bacterium]